MNVLNKLFAATIVAALLMLVSAFNAAVAVEMLSAAKAHEMAKRGEILLVDIRTPQEWRETKIGASAVPISMHNARFLDQFNTAIRGDKTKPVALICATGGRSKWLQKQLVRLGYRNIYDVSEGMMGSPAGPGWLKAGLPTKPVAQ